MTTDLQAVVASEMPLPFGVRAGSGSPLPGLNPNALQSIGVDPQSILEKADPKAHLGAVERVTDPNDLKQAGWGVILPAGISQDVVTALKTDTPAMRTSASAASCVASGNATRTW